MSLAGLLVANMRVGGKGVWWGLLGTHGCAADMFLIVGGIALAGTGLTFSVIGLVGNAIRRKRPLVVVAAAALLISIASLVSGAANYVEYLPMYEAYQEAMETDAQQESELRSSSPTSQRATP